ncbi:LytR C-terminal domain-containing protein, partial [bacterium]|nr:LytR C-terminal domain-containing protein [bacterium]
AGNSKTDVQLTKTATRASVAKSRAKFTSATSGGVKPRVAKVKRRAQRRRVAAWWSHLSQGVQVLTVVAGVAILLAIAVTMLLNTALPQFFHLEEEKNILLVGADISSRADVIYLVNVNPATQTTTVTRLSATTLVPVIGGFGQYPLGSVAPVLASFGANSLQEIRAGYTFALSSVIDEVYFWPELAEIRTAAELKNTFKSLIFDDLRRRSALDISLINSYFQIRANKPLAGVRQVSEVGQLAGGQAQLGRSRLVACPVTLMNAADVNGLASRTSQMLENSGFSVVNWDTAAQTIERSSIYYDGSEPDCLEVVALVQKIFPQLELVEDDGGAQGQKYRSKAVISLGRELAD